MCFWQFYCNSTEVGYVGRGVTAKVVGESARGERGGGINTGEIQRGDINESGNTVTGTGYGIISGARVFAKDFDFRSRANIF